MKKIYHILEAVVPNLLFIMLFLVMMLNIVVREFTLEALDWPIEFSRYSLVWLTFLGSVYLFTLDRHIKVDSFWNYMSHKFNRKVIKLIEVFKIMVIMFFCSYLSYYGCVFSERLKFFSSPSLNISQSYLYIVVPISGVIILIISLIKIYKIFSEKE